jgi:hypothetical protein
MNDDELMKVLEERKAVVVHFSHHSNMRDGGVFPGDMHEAIANKDKWPLSCSVLWPGHQMKPCGSVGVIFKPNAASVLSVSNTDSGSSTDNYGNNQSGGEPLTEENFEKTFQVVGGYNEWRVRGAEVVGIFVHDISCIVVKKHLQVPGLPDGECLHTIGGKCIPLSEVFDSFPNRPIYTMTPDGLKKLHQ